MKSFVQPDVRKYSDAWPELSGLAVRNYSHKLGKVFFFFPQFLRLKLYEGRGIDRANQLRQWIIDSLSPRCPQKQRNKQTLCTPPFLTSFIICLSTCFSLFARLWSALPARPRSVSLTVFELKCSWSFCTLRAENTIQGCVRWTPDTPCRS